MSKFNAVVVSCKAAGDYFEVVLDRTAFFPEGGGQASDEGEIDGARVTYVFEKDGVIYHRCGKQFDEGSSVECSIDYAERFRRMQNHSGEHILSGIAHSVFGAENVGFHLSEKYIRIDYDRIFTNDEIARLERFANEKIWENLKITAFYPTPEEKKKLNYRSKKEIDGELRLVSIEKTDLCACCAPHVKSTGEIGIIKICDHMKYKGGCRLEAVCGSDAYAMFAKEHEMLTDIARSASAKIEDVPSYIDRLKEEISNLRQISAKAEKELMEHQLENTKASEGNLCFFFESCEMNAMREFVNRAVKKCGGVCAAFCGRDDVGYRFIIASEKVKLKDKCKIINEILSAKCGGSDIMVQGSSSASRADTAKFFDEYTF